MAKAIVAAQKFLSTPSARRATIFFHPFPECCFISIHALREEGDTSSITALTATTYFYPRPPRGGRLSEIGERIKYWTFLSTPSARRATFAFSTISTMSSYFYPRPPRGGRPR